MAKITYSPNAAGLMTVRELDRLASGSVICSVSGLSRSPPFIVCCENAQTPRRNNGCPNGQVETFLVSLETGYRFNLDCFPPGALFAEVDCEMYVNKQVAG
jgi:hypothetical protein